MASFSAWVEFPFSVPDLFGVKGRAPVAAIVDDEPYRGSLMKMGGNEHMLVMVKALRETIGKQPGDTVQEVLERVLAHGTVFTRSSYPSPQRCAAPLTMRQIEVARRQRCGASLEGVKKSG